MSSEDEFGGGLVGIYEDTSLSSPVDSFYYDRALFYSNDYGTGLSIEDLVKYDTYTVTEDNGFVSESWDISESPDSDYIWYVIDGEACPKLFGVGEGIQKNDGGDDNGGDGDSDDDDGGNESKGSSGGGSGKAVIPDKSPVSNSAEIDEPDANEDTSSGGYSVELPEPEPINSLSVIGLFALGISAFVVVRRRNEDDDSTV